MISFVGETESRPYDIQYIPINLDVKKIVLLRKIKFYILDRRKCLR